MPTGHSSRPPSRLAGGAGRGPPAQPPHLPGRELGGLSAQRQGLWTASSPSGAPNLQVVQELAAERIKNKASPSGRAKQAFAHKQRASAGQRPAGGAPPGVRGAGLDGHSAAGAHSMRLAATGATDLASQSPLDLDSVIGGIATERREAAAAVAWEPAETDWPSSSGAGSSFATPASAPLFAPEPEPGAAAAAAAGLHSAAADDEVRAGGTGAGGAAGGGVAPSHNYAGLPA